MQILLTVVSPYRYVLLSLGRLELRKEACLIQPFDQKKPGRKKKKMSRALVRDDESSNGLSSSSSDSCDDESI